jgi:class 3 adenylate cyclase
MDQADAGEIVVSSVVRQLLDDQQVDFTPIGARELRGVPGRWELFKARHTTAP